jgi:hypothetical protein
MQTIYSLFGAKILGPPRLDYGSSAATTRLLCYRVHLSPGDMPDAGTFKYLQADVSILVADVLPLD